MPKYTLSHINQIESDIQSDLDFIISTIKDKNIQYDAIYLVGSFGRGEGSAHFDGHRWRGLNDYDLMIIFPDSYKCPFPLKEIGCEIAKALFIDFVDIGFFYHNNLPTLSPTLFTYDLKYASQLLDGKDVISEIPNFTSEQIPIYEFIRLLCNRSAGLMSTESYQKDESNHYHENQYVKACIAIGDIAEYLLEGYHCSYRKRQAIFHSIYHEGKLPFQLNEKSVLTIIEAYKKKLDGSYSFSPPKKELMQMMIANAYCALATQITGTLIQNVTLAERAFINHYRRKMRIKKYPKIVFDNLIRKKSDLDELLYYTILFSQPVFYCLYSKKGLMNSLEYIRRFFYFPEAIKRNWNYLSVVDLWTKYCH